MDYELDLMQRVKRLAGPYLEDLAKWSQVPVAFWAALTSLESGEFLTKNTDIPPRFEPGVFAHLAAVQAGTEHSYSGITQKMLATVTPDGLRRLASSWGFTQVLGYHALLLSGHSVGDFNDPKLHYVCAAKLMARFVADFRLDPGKHFEDMFRCWNSGSPYGQTFDPQYSANGVRRMAIWESLNPTNSVPIPKTDNV